MLLAEEEQINEPGHSNFGTAELLGSDGRIKPVFCLRSEVEKSPTSSALPSFLI